MTGLTRVLFVLVLLGVRTAVALDPQRHITELAHHVWDRKSGAPANIRALAQTTDGYLWVGSLRGLYRFDGMQFQPFESLSAARLPSPEIRSLFAAPDDKLDVVVFGAPQLSPFEMEAVAQALDGRQIHPDTTVIVATSPEIKHAADRMGLSARIEASGAVVAQGICFYQSYAREMAEANGWTRLMTNSAKLVNILGGYGYRSSLASLERCVDSAVAGRVL